MATTLTRWDPFAEFATMRSLMDRVLERGFPRFPTAQVASDEFGAGSLGVDVYETADQFVVKAAVAGVDPKDVDISVDDDVLTIKGESRQESETKDENYLRKELRFGSFERSLRLPPTVDADKAEAAFENGILKLTLPKKPEARSRTIKITPAGVIEAPKA
jgi:HSP20 family protein